MSKTMPGAKQKTKQKNKEHNKKQQMRKASPNTKSRKKTTYIE